MSTLLASSSSVAAVKTRAATLADLLERLGGIAPDRIRLDPPPGRATVKKLIEPWKC